MICILFVNMKDYYQTLGLARGATQEEIKKAYRRLAKQYHPDMNKGDKKAEERFKDISEAYSILSEPEKRKQYDMFGGAPFGAGAGGEGGFGGMRWEQSPGGGFKFYRDASTNQGAGDPLGQDYGNLGDIFAELFNMGGFKRGKPKWRPESDFGGEESGSQKGADTFTTLDIDFLEAVHGTEARLSIKRGDRTEKITVKIPAGVDNGSKVRIAGKGHPGIGDGEPGDLYISVRVNPHPIFWREDADIYTEIPISIYESVLGGHVEVPTLDGHATMKIPEGTESGQKFRLKGKGVSNLGKRGVGDQYVIVKIIPPKKLNEKTKEIFKQAKESNPYDPRGD